MIILVEMSFGKIQNCLHVSLHVPHTDFSYRQIAYFYSPITTFTLLFGICRSQTFLWGCLKSAFELVLLWGFVILMTAFIYLQ